MINESKLKSVKVISLIAIIVLLVLSIPLIKSLVTKDGNSVGFSEYQKIDVINVNPNDFLKKYYTKERVGKNRKDYKPYLTNQAYNQEKAKEENPSDKQYTDYMKDFEFQSAKYYFSKEEPIIFASVKYDFTAMSYNDVALVKDKKNLPKTKVVENRTDLKLTYKKVSGKWLIDKIEIVDLNVIN